VGLSLIEMLIALLVLSFGLLGVAGLIANSLKSNQNAYLRSQANFLAYEIIDRIRANRATVIANPATYALNDVDSTSALPVAVGGDCATNEAMPSCDLKTWQALLARSLPNAGGAVECDGGSGICRVRIDWEEDRGAGKPVQIRLSTEI
jgi:type IV pilus assembly protein PilV